MCAGELERVLEAVSRLRLPQAQAEAALGDAVAACLGDAGIPFRREAPLGPRARIDFLTEGGVGIELKKGRPGSALLRRQLERYAASPQVEALLVVTQKTARLPERIGGKRCLQISLNRLWGIAI